MRHDFLHAVEASRINDLEHFYLTFRDPASAELVARANLYKVEMDFATMDKKLPREARAAIKSWYPHFMRFQLLECGLFTMVGEGLELRSPEHTQAVLERLVSELESICREQEADFFLIRDIPTGSYESFSQALLPLGFRPVLGFANAALDIRWSSLEEYLASLDAKTRYKLKTSLQFDKRYQVECEVVGDYAELAPVLARLWKNVNQSASDYSREQLDEHFFSECARHLKGRSELILFKHRGTPIAFMFNLIGDDDYIMLDWGVDYDFEHYRTANLYRAASVLSLEAAIRHGKKRMELGITNYTPKQLLGAKVLPLVYFLRHKDNPEHTHTLTRLMATNIEQPELPDEEAAELSRWAARVRRDQDELGDQDIFQKVEQQHKFGALKLGGIYGLYPEFKTAQRSSIQFDDQSGVVLLGTNSYLGLSTHPAVVEAARRAIDQYGTGCSGSPLLNGTLDIHKRLEAELASFTGKEAVVLCSTGYQANLTALSALAGHDDLLIMDARNHRSLFDGAKLSGADIVIYKHGDMEHLRRVLARNASRRKLIVTDSVFSMEGTIAPLATLCDLAAEFGARVYVDESHAFGVLGPGGRGVCEFLGVLDRVDLVMGTFSKSLAALGGFVAGSRKVIDYIKHNGSGHIFSASLPPPVIETVRTALRIIQDEPERRTALLRKAAYMATALRELGYQAEYHGAPIVPIVLGDYTLTLAAYKRLMHAGVYVNPVGPPAVPAERSGFRTSYMANHEWGDLQRALGVFASFRDQLTH
jgi:8-amino-7-oxononanoate synthase